MEHLLLYYLNPKKKKVTLFVQWLMGYAMDKIHKLWLLCECCYIQKLYDSSTSVVFSQI